MTHLYWHFDPLSISSTKENNKKKHVSVGPTLTKLFGSAHAKDPKGGSFRRTSWCTLICFAAYIDPSIIYISAVSTAAKFWVGFVAVSHTQINEMSNFRIPRSENVEESYLTN